jgi:hypothetical protein
MFWEVVGLEQCPLSLVSTIEELLERKSSDSGLETEITAAWIRRADHVAPSYSQKLALTSPTSGGRSVGTVRSRAQATEFFRYRIKLKLRMDQILHKEPFNYVVVRSV